jgi:hypothetical protein
MMDGFLIGLLSILKIPPKQHEAVSKKKKNEIIVRKNYTLDGTERHLSGTYPETFGVKTQVTSSLASLPSAVNSMPIPLSQLNQAE